MAVHPVCAAIYSLIDAVGEQVCLIFLREEPGSNLKI
jgi:hypothetical protein